MRWTLLPILVALMSTAAAAEGVPACEAARAGQLACVAGRLCRCAFEPGGSLAGHRDRWAWDCGLLRPDCAVPPADLSGARRDRVPALLIAPRVSLPGRPPQAD